MSKLIGFFLAGPAAPARIQALLIGAAAVAIAMLSLLVWGLYWRGEYRELKVATVVYADQVKVTAGALEACSAGTDAAKRAGDAAVSAVDKLLGQAQAGNADRKATAARLDEIARRTRNAGEGCDWAWDHIERDAQVTRAKRDQPARAAP